MSLTLDPRSTAIVLIEYQNDFTTDSVLHGAELAPEPVS